VLKKKKGVETSDLGFRPKMGNLKTKGATRGEPIEKHQQQKKEEKKSIGKDFSQEGEKWTKKSENTMGGAGLEKLKKWTEGPQRFSGRVLQHLGKGSKNYERSKHLRKGNNGRPKQSRGSGKPAKGKPKGEKRSLAILYGKEKSEKSTPESLGRNEMGAEEERLKLNSIQKKLLQYRAKSTDKTGRGRANGRAQRSEITIKKESGLALGKKKQ